MKTAEERFDQWANFDARDPWVFDEYLKELFQDIVEEAYLQGYEDATKGDDPEFPIPY